MTHSNCCSPSQFGLDSRESVVAAPCEILRVLKSQRTTTARHCGKRGVRPSSPFVSFRVLSNWVLLEKRPRSNLDSSGHQPENPHGPVVRFKITRF